MHYATIENISKSFGIRTLFKNISFYIEEGDKIAFVARNGSGKSTLLKIIAGLDNADSGTLWVHKDIKVIMLQQDTVFDETKSIWDNVLRMDNPVVKVVKEYEMCLEEDAENIDKLTALMARVDELNAWNFESELQQILGKLNLHHLNEPIKNLSGGQRKRLSQYLMALQAHLEVFQLARSAGNAQKSEAELARLVDCARSSVRECRRLVAGSRTELLNESTLPAAIRKMVEGCRTRWYWRSADVRDRMAGQELDGETGRLALGVVRRVLTAVRRTPDLAVCITLECEAPELSRPNECPLRIRFELERSPSGTETAWLELGAGPIHRCRALMDALGGSLEVNVLGDGVARVTIALPQGTPDP